MRLFESSPEALRRNRWMSALVLLAGAGLSARQGGGATQKPVVELRGDLPAPGFYEVEPSLDAALVAAGGDPSGWPDQGLRHGDRVDVRADGLRVSSSAAALALGLPVDLNAASVEGLATLPGLGPRRAEAVIEDRARNGPFLGLDDLDRVKGIGPGTIQKLEGLAVARAPEARPDIERSATSR